MSHMLCDLYVISPILGAALDILKKMLEVYFELLDLLLIVICHVILNINTSD